MADGLVPCSVLPRPQMWLPCAADAGLCGDRPAKGPIFTSFAGSASLSIPADAGLGKKLIDRVKAGDLPAHLVYIARIPARRAWKRSRAILRR